MTGAGRRLPAGAPGIGVLVGLAAGLAVTVWWGWQPGLVLLGLVLVVAAGVRWQRPAAAVGLISARSRGLDAGLLAGAGAALVVLAVTLPR